MRNVSRPLSTSSVRTAPESADTGTDDGDEISIDAVKGTISVDLSQEELSKRAKKWKPRQTDYQSGALWKYAQTVGTARLGAVTHPGGAKETHVYAHI